MEFLQNILDGSNFPILSAFILGIMAAISPCPLATNITAIAYIGKNLDNKRSVFVNGLIYTLGRVVTYVGIATVLYYGASTFHVASFFTKYGERFLGPVMIFIGIFMLDFIKINLPGLGKITDRFQQEGKKVSWVSSLLLGILFALAFCPYCAMIFFGILMPLTIASPAGLALPLVFAITTGLPVIIFAFLIAFTLSSVGGLYNKLRIFEKWFRRVVAVLFILVGFYFVYTYFIK